MFQKLSCCYLFIFFTSLIVSSMAVAELVASYDFEDNFKDTSGNDLHGKEHNGASIVKDADRESQVLLLDGKNDYVNIGNDKRFDWGGAFSACFWMKVNLWQVNWETVLKKDNVFSFERDIGREALAFYHWPGFVPTTMDIDDQWHHIAATYDKKAQKFYKDGELIANKPNAADMNINPKPIIIGAADGTTRYFNGRMDDVRIYSKALSEDEVKKSMTALERQATDPRHKLTIVWGRIKVLR
ncbi:hypothetical protein CMK22_02850 [Candidatus Poribacteria bacterium]|nr:hypothetical protein [Candidatus Poribacteria bacterium]